MRILLVTPATPYSFAAGSHQRTHVLWKALSELGTVEVLKITADTTISAPQDKSFVAEVTYQTSMLGLGRFFPSRALGRLISEYVDLRDYDVICGRYLRPVSMLPIPRGIPTVVDLDDFRADYYGAPASPRSALSGVTAALRRRVRWALEDQATRRFTRFWFVTDRDRERNPHLKGGTLRNIPRRPSRAPDPAS